MLPNEENQQTGYRKLIAPSILSADFTRLGQEIEAVEKAGADWIHIDVMDGQFVPNITMGPLVVEAAKRVTSLPLDVHLMIEQPDRYIEQFAKAGASYIVVHAETCPHLNRTVQHIRETGCRPGVALNPSTPVSCLDWVLDSLDLVVVMSVNPGFGGQKFIPSSLEKIYIVRKMIHDRCSHALIQVDGGVNPETIEQVSEAGADVFVAGSAIFGTADYAATIGKFREILNH